MRRILSLVLALLMLLSAFSCLTVTGFAADTALTEKESNDTEETANSITVAKTYEATLQSESDVDWYKFTSDKDYFKVNFGAKNKTDTEGMTDSWKMTLYDSSFAIIDTWYRYSQNSTVEIPITGIVYIKIESSDKYYGNCSYIPYVITANTYTDSQWEDEYNENSDSAKAMLSNTQYTGSLQGESDVDWYEFTSDKDYFTINFGAKNSTDTEDMTDSWRVSIYDSNMAMVDYWLYNKQSSTYKYAITGTIYVKVESSDKYYGNCSYIPYVITANTYTDSQWEDEYNNASTTANKIEQGKKYKATLYSVNDIDFFKFTAKSDAFKVKVSVDLNETSVETIKDGWKLTIYPSDSASSIVGNYTVSSIGSFETRVLPYEKGKEYFIKIQASNSNKVPVNAIYNLEIVDATDGKKWEKENGQNAFEYATTVNIGEVVYGNLYSSSDYDHYKISVPTDGIVNFTFTREEDDRIGDGWKFYLKNAAGTVVYTGEAKDILSGKSENIDVKKGNYYLIVTSKNNSAPSSDIDYNIQLNYSMHTPKITKVSNAANGIAIKWNKTAGVASYILYRREYNASTKKWSGWKAIAKPVASATSFVDKTAKSGVSYRYTLRGVYGSLTSPFVSTGTLLCLAQPKTTVKAVSNGINVNWTQSAGATGYTVYRMEYNAKTKKWTGWKNMATAKKNAKSWTDKSAKKGVTYKYTVRAVNGKNASSYTASNSVKR